MTQTDVDPQPKVRYYVQLACFCQSAAFQEGQALSLTGIVGQVAFRSVEPVANISFQVPLKFVLSVSPTPQGLPHTASFKLSFVAPNGAVTGRGVVEMTFQRGQGYGVIILDAVLNVNQRGTHWMEVRSGRALLTRVPLNVDYENVEAATTPAEAIPSDQPL